MAETLIASTLLENEYYAKKIPLYLRNNNAFMTHFRIWVDFLQTLEPNERTFLGLLDIFDEDYLSKYEDPNEDEYTLDMLDKIGAIFNLQRAFTVDYIFNGTSTTSSVKLKNKEYLTFIKAQIIKDYFDGSKQSIDEFYSSVGLSQIYQQNGKSPANCVLIFLSEDLSGRALTNLEKLFLSGYLTIESFGITYHRELFDIALLLYWNVGIWDGGYWS